MASADQDQDKSKKRKPPSFPYHHPSQARKLRAQWIEREKVKSKWRAEKRRDPTLRSGPSPLADGTESDQPVGVEEEEWTGIQEQSEASPKSQHPDRGTAPSQARRREQRTLAREAYSPASLHHQKSRFNHRRPHKDGNERFATSGGQPNMKLRMNVLLDKIKRTVD